jgi:hypothetical protein
MEFDNNGAAAAPNKPIEADARNLSTPSPARLSGTPLGDTKRTAVK